MPDRQEVLNGLFGAYRLAWFDGSGMQCDPDVQTGVGVNVSDCCDRGRVAGTADVHAVGTDRVYRTQMTMDDEVQRR